MWPDLTEIQTWPTFNTNDLPCQIWRTFIDFRVRVHKNWDWHCIRDKISRFINQVYLGYLPTVVLRKIFLFFKKAFRIFASKMSFVKQRRRKFFRLLLTSSQSYHLNQSIRGARFPESVHIFLLKYIFLRFFYTC